MNEVTSKHRAAIRAITTPRIDLVIVSSLFAASAGAAPATTRAFPAPASLAASTAPPVIVLQAQIGEPPATLPTAVGTVLDALGQRGFVAHPSSIAELLGDRVPRPGVLDIGKTAGDIVALSQRGFEAFSKAQYRNAAAMLGLAVDQIERNPGLLVLDAANTRPTFQAFVGLALSQARLGNTAASIETMTEVLRSFSTQVVDRAEYGPQAEQRFRDVQKQTREMIHGRLDIAVDDRRAMIFVNGELRGTGQAALTELIPGTYRVFIHVPGTTGRQYRVSVRSGDLSKLEVSWPVDSALIISEAWVGFAFASEAERENAPIYAGVLARRWGQKAVVVVETLQLQGTRALHGSLLGAEGEVIRSALVALDGDQAKLRSLARFIADGTSSPDLTDVTEPDRRGTVRERARMSGTNVPAWPFLAAGAVALGVGIGLLAMDEDFGHLDDHGVRPPYYRDTAPFGVAVGLAGVASVGFGLWWWRTHGRESSAPTLSLGPAHAVVGWAGWF